MSCFDCIYSGECSFTDPFVAERFACFTPKSDFSIQEDSSL